MIPTDQTHIPVSSLYAEGDEPSKYGYKKSFVYQALKDLGIERKIGADGVAAYIAFKDLDVLDEYVRIRKEKGKKASEEFALKRSGQSVERSIESGSAIALPSSTDASTLASLSPALMVLVEAIASRMSEQPSDPLLPQRQLKEAWREGWALSSSQVREILGVKGWSGQPRYGFVFYKLGKIGRESGWIVKLDSGIPEN
ncbi:MAG: hypothetical protein DCF25_16530 [Leptolyngbya foveolarum]|uniref:Uncharacterized protein n=1 Tax=Leptolyngbya foveolarum TaxID=47253 RepID=A0A2W4TZK9_9CYAN|nr:MAG: hypothetical protein DCF25_16530 [Leptolyngbya foveolarum]